MYSLRRALALRFSLTMFVALLLVAFWAYMGTQRILRNQLDNSLNSALHLSAASVAAGRHPPRHPGPPEVERFIREVNRFVAVRDSSAQIVGSNTPLASDLPFDQTSFDRARGGIPAWRTLAWRHGSVRSMFAPAPPGGADGAAVIQVGASLGPTNAVNRSVVLLMLGTVVLGSVATLFGAGWLARAAVEPMGVITSQASAIKPGATGQRITAHADVAECQGLVRVLNAMLERLDRAFDAQRRIIADVGHELRTPITAMRGELEVALRGKRSVEEYRTLLRSALEEVDHLESIGEALIMLARIEARDMAPQLRPTDLVDVARRATERAKPKLNGRTVEFDAAGEPDTTAVIDPDLIAIALGQLLDNVMAHTPPGPDTRVGVTITQSSEDVTVSVTDNGPGIPEEALPYLFERFFRVDPARSRGYGPGLGLTVVAAIVDTHGGRAQAAAAPGGGLEVSIILPRNARGTGTEPAA